MTSPRPQTSGSKVAGRFGKQDFAELLNKDAYRCPAGAPVRRRGRDGAAVLALSLTPASFRLLHHRMASTVTTTSRAGSLPLVGGVLALDFCNTSSGRGTDGHIEHLLTCANILAWAHLAGILDVDTEAKLRDRFESDERLGKRMLARAVKLRDAIYGLVADLAAGRETDRRHLDAVGEAYARCVAMARLTTQNGGFGWTWSPDHAPEEAVIGPIAVSAMAVISDADRARLKQCEGHHCGWLFLDTTKSNNRRWCEMEVCGNRAKQTRMRRRNGDAPA